VGGRIGDTFTPQEGVVVEGAPGGVIVTFPWGGGRFFSLAEIEVRP
jgi:hypothetical protein